MTHAEKYVFDDMKKHIESIFDNMKNDISEVVKNHFSNYKFNKNNIYLNYNINKSKININSFSLQGKFKKYKFKNVYKFEVNEDLCKNEDEPYYYTDGKNSENHPLDNFIETMNSICVSIEYNNEIHNYDTIKKKREMTFNIACALTLVGKYGFAEQINYFNGKNMIKYI